VRIKRRYKIGYALACGNTFPARHGNGEEAEAFYFLHFAQAFAEIVRIELALSYNTFCVFVTDLDNEEAGDLSSVDADEYEERYAQS
jgi:hypothetical protein